MNFKQKIQSIKITGETKKGNTLGYIAFSEIDLAFYQPDGKRSKVLEAWDNASRININCSFDVKTGMAELMEQSKILLVDGISNAAPIASITIVPLPMFTFDKLKDVLCDLCEKFDL